MDELQTACNAHQVRLTTPRKKVFETLKDTEKPLPISAIIAACPTINRVSIYRSLELFEKLGIVELIYVGWKKRYELAAPFKPHHHHLQCITCGEHIPIDTPALEKLVTTLATSHNYQLLHHHIELRGVCPRCITHSPM